MNLWFSSHFLFAGLFLSVSALTDEECQPLVKPLSLADHGTLHDRVHFIMGYTDTEAYNSILRTTDSSWLKMSPSGDNQLVMQQENKINGTCFSSKESVTIDGDTATVSITNITTTFQLLPTCDGCLLFKGKSVARNLDKFYQLLKISSSVTEEEEVTTNALYLMAKQTNLTDSDLQVFRQQASCLGFSGEPIFHIDPTKEFCVEGEGVQIVVP